MVNKGEPHQSISSDKLYKHICPELSEPARMKQLLVWCGERALKELLDEEPLNRKSSSALSKESMVFIRFTPT
jgi:kinetochore protein Mis13/DSN1